MSTTVKKYKIQQLQDNNDMLELHPETDADIVNYSKTIDGTPVTNVKGALDKIVEGIGVTGVKGNAETNYRTGQVNITPADIGAQPILTWDDTPTANSNNPVKSKGIKSYVDSAKQDVIAIAEGKTRNIVIDYTATGTDVINTSFNSNVQELRIDYSKYIKPYSGANILLSDLKVGDIISVTQTNVPDRWLGGFAGGEAIFLPLEIKLDIDTIVTQNSTNPVSSGAVYTALHEDIGYVEISSATATLTDAQLAEINKKYCIIYYSSSYYYKVNIDFSGVIIFESYSERNPRSYTNDFAIIFNYVIVNPTSSQKVFENYSIDSKRFVIFGKALGVYSSDQVNTLLNAKYEKPSSGIPSSDLANTGVAAGTYSAVTVNAKGLVTAGAQMLEVGSSGQTTPSASLAVGGIFFKEI